MSLQIFDSLEQGSSDWLEARRGVLTASQIGKLLTAGLKVADNETSRGLTATLVAERLTGFIDEQYVNADMERGHEDEPIARAHYSEHVAEVTECGFMVRQDFGYRIGFSPDGLVRSDGLVEFKSRRPKTQITTTLSNAVPADNMAQLQCGLFVSGRDWIDYCSWSGGLPMWVIRVKPDPQWFDVITEAAEAFEDNAARMIAAYNIATSGLPATERIDHWADAEIVI